MTLGYSRKSVRLLVSDEVRRHGQSCMRKPFAGLAASPAQFVVDNLREAVLTPDIYEPYTQSLISRHASALRRGDAAVQGQISGSERQGREWCRTREKIPLKGSASKVSRRLRITWIIEKPAGLTRASIARPNGRWPLCSPKNDPPCCRCQSSLFATTYMESVRSIWTAVWKLWRLFTAYRPAGSVQWDSRQVRLLDPKTGQLLREHLRMALGGHRINDEDRSGKTPLVTQQLLARADKAGSQIGANCPSMQQTQGETSVRRIMASCLGAKSMAWHGCRGLRC
jgi:hypothetical protein